MRVIEFIAGFIVGGIVGILITCMIQINQE